MNLMLIAVEILVALFSTLKAADNWLSLAPNSARITRIKSQDEHLFDISIPVLLGNVLSYFILV